MRRIPAESKWEGNGNHDNVNTIRDHSVRVEGVYDSVGEAEKSAKHFENNTGGSNGLSFTANEHDR